MFGIQPEGWLFGLVFFGGLAFVRVLYSLIGLPPMSHSQGAGEDGRTARRRVLPA